MTSTNQDLRQRKNQTKNSDDPSGNHSKDDRASIDSTTSLLQKKTSKRKPATVNFFVNSLFLIAIVLFVSLLGFVLWVVIKGNQQRDGFVLKGPTPSVLNGSISESLGSKNDRFGGWEFEWSSSQQLLVKSGTTGSVVWSSLPGRPFIYLQKTNFNPIFKKGNLRIEQEILSHTDKQTIQNWSADVSKLTITGSVWQKKENCSFDYGFTLAVRSSRHLRFDLDVTPVKDGDCSEFDSVALLYGSNASEGFYGFGESFTHHDLRGKAVPVVTREQGIGRGLEPTTTLLNVLEAFTGGDSFTTYTSIPHYITSMRRSIFLENYEFAYFDLRDSILKHDPAVLISVHMGEKAKRGARRSIRGGILHSPKADGSLLPLVEEYTQHAGRMKALPEWVHDGVILGIQGGQSRVKEIVGKVKNAEVSLTGVWLQDWCGRRLQTIAGQSQFRLWWNWEPDADLYPSWRPFVQNLTHQNVQVLAYINPYIADVELAEKQSGYKRNLFKEGRENKHMLRDRRSGQVFVGSSGPNFEYGILDLTSTEARAWYKKLIKDHFIDVGVKGWMADFGESIPYDTDFRSSQIATSSRFSLPVPSNTTLSKDESQLVNVDHDTFHNIYPQEWARLNREALLENGVDDDTVFFVRSASSLSPGIARAFWAGDQMPSLVNHDGLESALNAMLSSGLSGFSMHHSDLGGYTVLPYRLLPGLYFRRDEETMVRWFEVGLFGAMFRSHEGSIPSWNVQPYDDDALRDLKYFTDLFTSLTPYRKQLFTEAATKGYPLMRHMFLHFPSYELSWSSNDQFMYGADVLVAPVVTAGQQSRSVFLPPAEDDGTPITWIHIWTGRVYGGAGSEELVHQVDAPLRRVPIFVKQEIWEMDGGLLGRFKSIVEAAETDH
ncbi:hypothetical protein HK102_005309 [Quaeritorhiza haematococci]|nr:hypothetical protein HK102_005309 [Quaeritorhiza haematococci]